MATSVSRPTRLTPAWCLACFVACGALSQLCFVAGITWAQRDARATERFNWQGAAEGDARALSVERTSRIKHAPSAKALIEVLDEILDGPFDFYQASSSYHSLATWKRRRSLQSSDWDSPVIARLHARVRDMVLQDELGARELANVLWSIATLSDEFSLPTQLLVALVKSLPDKAEGMKPQHLSNCLWACAKLEEVAPNVLQIVPAIAAQIPDKAKGMKPQELSNCLWACAQLKDNASEVLEIVVPIVVEVSMKIKDMNAEDLRNLEALVPLQELVPEIARLVADDDREEDILRSSVARLRTLLPRLRGKDLSVAVPSVIWACAKLGVYPDDLLHSVSQHLGSRNKLSKLLDFSLCALAWSYQVLDAQDDFKDFKELLKSVVRKRGFSETDIESTRLGSPKWNAKLEKHGPARD
eukprot:Skav208046  [mRNA]  locus=scaffold1124:15189:16430:- [translate_table: standard]